MSASFRDLFVELPAALFEVLKGIGERAVAQAPRQPTPHHRPSMFECISQPSVLSEYNRLYGWRSVTMWKSEKEPAVVYRARLRCGHRHEFSISEIALEDVGGPSAYFDMLDKIATKTPCSCMQQRDA